MAQAQSNYVRAALDRLDAVADGASYDSSLSFDVSRVPAGQHFQRSTVPATGSAVRVSAACDNDCSRLELRVVDFQNRRVAYEQPHAGASTLLFYPQPGQTYRVYAQPLDCSAAYCYVVVGVWQ
ncbi:MAG: hypothetical protein V7678_00710 [Brevundimonas sp.]